MNIKRESNINLRLCNRLCNRIHKNFDLWYGKTAITPDGKVGRVIGTDNDHWCIVVEFQDNTTEIMPPWCFKYLDNKKSIITTSIKNVQISNNNPENFWIKRVFNTKLPLLEYHALKLQDLGVILISIFPLITLTLFYSIGSLAFTSFGVLALGLYLIKKSSKVIKGIDLINKYDDDDDLQINVIRAECFSQSTNLWLGRPGK